MCTCPRKWARAAREEKTRTNDLPPALTLPSWKEDRAGLRKGNWTVARRAIPDTSTWFQVQQGLQPD